MDGDGTDREEDGTIWLEERVRVSEEGEEYYISRGLHDEFRDDTWIGDEKMIMPDDVEIYISPAGSKVHLWIVCAGRNAEKKTISEVDFLERLENGKGCKNCCSPDSMIKVIKKDLKEKEDLGPDNPHQG